MEGGRQMMNARRRLMGDYKEMMERELDTISAAPVDESDMFRWHANLAGPIGLLCWLVRGCVSDLTDFCFCVFVL